jgi:hypothetical protein
MSSDASAGGVHFDFGVDVPPPVVVERTPVPPPMVVERASPAPPVVIERTSPGVVYQEPLVVERRSSVYYYYRPSYQYRSYHVETERGYYRQRGRDWEDDGEY